MSATAPAAPATSGGSSGTATDPAVNGMPSPDGRGVISDTERAAALALSRARASKVSSLGLLIESDAVRGADAGNALAARTFEMFLAETGWSRADIQRVVTHQVGVAHRRLLLSTLGLADEIDWSKVALDSCSVRAVFGGRKPAPIPPIAAKMARSGMLPAMAKGRRLRSSKRGPTSMTANKRFR